MVFVVVFPAAAVAVVGLVAVAGVVGVAEVVGVVAAELDVLYYFQTKSEVFYLRPF